MSLVVRCVRNYCLQPRIVCHTSCSSIAHNDAGRFGGPLPTIRHVDHYAVLRRPIATTARRSSTGTGPCNTHGGAPDVSIGPSVPTYAELVHRPRDRHCVQETEGQVCGHSTAANAQHAVVVGRFTSIAMLDYRWYINRRQPTQLGDKRCIATPTVIVGIVDRQQ